MKKKILLTNSLILLSFLAQAEGISKNFYIKLNAGYSNPKNLNNDFNESKTLSSPVYGVALGYQLNSTFAADISFDYRVNYKNNLNQNSDDFGQENYQTKVKSQTLMANIYYNFNYWNSFVPYITLGAGIANNSTNNTRLILQDYEPEINTTLYGKTQTNFAYKAGCGISYKIKENIDVSLQYQFINLGTVKTSSTVKFQNGISASDNGFIHKSKLQSQEFLLGLSYKF